ncbi:hypothetical protein ACODT3_10750 [Streptomyces sp. 4.24]|uniref:hypothetical protein n=1 Tax=Streptomyces tritrimontium TaxID=3406573 RepID=UPI003BB66F54
MSDVDALYLDAELLVLTARQAVCPRSRVVATGQPFPGFGLTAPDKGRGDDQSEYSEEWKP